MNNHAEKITISEQLSEPDCSETNIFLPNIEKIADENTVVRSMAREYENSEIPHAVNEMLGEVPEKYREIIAYAFNSHVTKERPLTIIKIAQEVGIDDQESSKVAAIADLLWNTAILMDDIIDGDEESGGQEAAWVKFRKIPTMRAIRFALSAGASYSLKTYGMKGLSVYGSSSKAIKSVVSARRISLESSEELLYKNYDDRSSFYTSMPMRLLGINQDKETVNKLIAAGDSLQLMNRAGQLINDVQDYDESAIDIRENNLSDVQNGTVSLPIVWAWHEFNDNQKNRFRQLFKSTLTDDQKKEVKELYSSVQLTDIMREKIYGLYYEALDIYMDAIEPSEKTLNWIGNWIDYKLNQIDSMTDIQ